MSPLIVFLDLGGVINDKEQQFTQWQDLAGECFVKMLGGTKEAWAFAHRVVTERLLNWEKAQSQSPVDFRSFYRSYQLHWVRGMCEVVGILTPPEEECFALACRAVVWISCRIRAALPGAVEAIRLLHQQGRTLHMASGSCSLELAGYLDGMGVRHCFGCLYGADLINTFKEGPEYYARLFTDAGIRPAEALVVDDSLHAINWATRVGAKAILVSFSSYPEARAMPRIGSLAELPAFLHQQG